MDDTAVLITGVGAVTPLGNDFRTFADGLFAGRSGAKAVNDQSADGENSLPACLVSDDLAPPPGWDARQFGALPRVERTALFCVDAALRDAGWDLSRQSPRVGLVLGLGGEWLRHWETTAGEGTGDLFTGGENDSLVLRTQQRLGAVGPTLTIGAACASGNYAAAVGRQWVRSGLVDVCVAAGVELITALCRAAFNNLRALSRRSDSPQQASRPFDADRDGFVIGEGAAAVVLERAGAARQRGAKIFGEIAGFGATSDAYHMIIPRSDPEPAAQAMREALADARLNPSDVSYINAHATSTPVGDKAEAQALHRVFGERVAHTPVSSTKSMTGHLLSAAASIELLACLAAFERQALPPTINLDNPDPECQLLHVPHFAREARVDVALSNSFGFGGSNTSLVLRRAA